MIRETFPVGPLQCNCSIVGDEPSRQALVIDPGDDIPEILARLARHSLKLTHILVTHAHIDHIAGAERLKSLTGAPVLYSELDLPLVRMMDVQAGWLGVPVPEVSAPDEALRDGSRIVLGDRSDPTHDPLILEVRHTPGHTPGSLCLHLPDHHLLFAGDTLFAGSVGRTDLPGGDTASLLRSIRTQLFPLPEQTVVIAGHGPSTTLAAERESNPFLQNL